MLKEEIQIVKQAQAGVEGAFDELYYMFYDRIYAIAYRVMNNCDADAQDAAQETLLEIHKSLPNLKEPSFFYAWTIRIVISKCNRIYRRNKEVYVDPLKIQSMITYEDKRTYMNPKKAADNVSEQEVLLGIIYSLKPQFAIVLELMYIQQLKLHEIAEQLNLPLGTVKTRAVRGRRVLKEQIELFEQLEDRKLNFHLHMPFTIVAYVGLISIAKFIIGQGGNSVKHMLSGGAAQSVCIASFCALGVTGVKFAYDDVSEQRNNAVKEVANEKQTNSVSTLPNQAQNINENTFPQLTYKEDTVASSLDAFYTCINWAYDEEDMRQYSKTEIEEIVPIYVALKKKQDAYWEKLMNKQWHIPFENLLNEYGIAM